MSKSIFFSVCLALSPSFAHAEYMGIDEVPVSNSDINTVFLSSIKGKDFKAIEAWKDKVSQVYDQTGFCGFASGYVYPATEVKKDIITYPNDSSRFLNVMSYDYMTIIPTDCKSISLWNIYNTLDNDEYSYDIFKSVGALGQLDKSHVKFADTYEQRRALILDFMKKIPNDKYAMFLPIITQNDADFKIRNLAFDKYLEGRKAEENKTPDQNDLVVQLKEKIKDGVSTNKSWIGTFNDKMYMSLFQPDLLILTEMNKKTLDSLYVYWTFYKNKKGILPPFNKEVIAKGGYSDEELKNLNLNNLDEVNLYRFYNTNQMVRLFHRAFTNYVNNGNDLNIQKDNGNTMLTEMITNRNYRLTNSPFAASFIRFYLENGANPLLQNKDGDTAFSAFVKRYGDNDDTYEIKKAFVQKQYDFNPNDLK